MKDKEDKFIYYVELAFKVYCIGFVISFILFLIFNTYCFRQQILMDSGYVGMLFNKKGTFMAIDAAVNSLAWPFTVPGVIAAILAVIL